MKNTSKFLVLAGLVFASLSAVRAEVETYTIDPVHSSIGFSIRHFVSKVPGTFTKYTGTITVDTDNIEKSSTEAVITVGSVNTGNSKRDEHLQSPDFFDVAKFETITFKSTSWKKTGEDAFDVAGNLTIHGVTKPVVLKTKLLGFGPGMGGVQLSGWEATTTLSKSDFGVNGPAMLGKALGDEVVVTLNIEAYDKKKE
ncbi:MAG: polyisoprenoid-binding protein [Verrucomicrobia bacterium]|nr:polyisoprenoid-binding protein [Verrucomicrobiota bacterium]